MKYKKLVVRLDLCRKENKFGDRRVEYNEIEYRVLALHEYEYQHLPRNQMNQYLGMDI